MKVAVALVALVALLGAASAQTTKSFDSPLEALNSVTDNPDAPCVDMAKAFILASNASTEFEDYKGKKLTVFIPSDAAFTAAGLNETSVQTLATTEEGMKILGYHQVAGAGLTAEAIKRLPEVNSAKGRSMATALCEGKPGCPNVVVVKAGAPTGNTRKLLQVTASPSPAVADAGVSPSPAVAMDAGVSPSPAMDAMPMDAGMSPSPGMDMATTEVSPAPMDATATTEVSPAPMAATAVEASPAMDATAVEASPAMAATAMDVSPAPMDATATTEVSPAPVDASAAVGLPGVSPDMPVDAGADATLPGTSPEPVPADAAATEPTKVCAPGTPTGITVNDGLTNTPANVIYGDLASGEVIMHVIDRVLLPPGMTMAQVNKAIAAADAAAAEAAAVPADSPATLEALPAGAGGAAAVPSPPPKSSAAGVAVSVAAALAPAVLLAML